MTVLPADWGEGYDNVNLGCTVENQEIAEDEAVKDFASDLINTKIKQIWD